MATLIATAVRGSLLDTQMVVPSGNPAHVRLDMVSAVFPTDPSLSFAVDVQESQDGGATWTPYFGSVKNGGDQGRSLGPKGIDSGLWYQIIQFDGVARLLKINITVNTPFSWGLTGTIMAT